MRIQIIGLGIALLAPPTLGQTRLPRTAPEETVTIIQNNTGGRPDIVISRGPTGADTITNNSAAGGNASRPELRIPNGSGGGGGGNGGR